jgi:hypothetical protein
MLYRLGQHTTKGNPGRLFQRARKLVRTTVPARTAIPTAKGGRCIGGQYWR